MLPSMKWMKFIAYISSCMTGSELTEDGKPTALT